jgi:hypothetical protein
MPQSFGSFSEGPDGRFIAGDPRPRFRLLRDFGYRDPQGQIWRVPAGVEVDGASIPQLFWSIIGGPFEGNYIHASVVHDHFCTVRSRSSEATHRAFYLGMRAKGVADRTATKMFQAVAAFGPRWRLRSGGPESAGGEPVAEPLPDVDLDDPAARAEAERLIDAFSESLDASYGATFATADGGTAPATLESLEAEADRLRARVAAEGGAR